MNPIADFECVLDVQVHCDTCKMKMMEVLHSIAEQGEVKVSGEVNPHMLLKAIARSGTGKHGMLKYAVVNHHQARRMSNYCDENSYNHGSNFRYRDSNYYNAIEDPYAYGYRRPMLGGHSSHSYSQPMDYHHQTRRVIPEYNDPYYGSNYYQNSYPPALPPLLAARSRQFHY